MPGDFHGDSPLGDESWVNAAGIYSNAMLFRFGRLVVFISGSASGLAMRQGKSKAFPQAAVEAVAYQILLAASRQAYLTGVSAQTPRLMVNGKPLNGKPLMTSKQIYVPVVEFAKAMGLQSRWDSKTGALTLSAAKRQTITVTAASTEAKVGAKSVALKTPVLRGANQPVMALDDLLMLVKGKVITRKGDTVEVKA